MRTLTRIIPSVATSDGAGVQLRRSLGGRQGASLDPFLMLDEFYSDNADDYIAGFPSHPHRGFETVTYMLNGHMRHEDHLGNRGDLQAGDVQWMTAARGIIHSEMPQQTSGRLRGFQLWLNLPARDKMKPAHYRDVPAREIPVATLDGGAQAKVIAGRLQVGQQVIQGAIDNEAAQAGTDPLYLDLHIPAGSSVEIPLTSGYSAFLYLYEGQAQVGAPAALQALPPRAAGVLSDGDRVRIQAGTSEARALLLAARPLREPVVQYGPFVMNTREEIEQAIEDFRSGRLAAVGS